jgi:membrane-associated phospholipid phosphatase
MSSYGFALIFFTENSISTFVRPGAKLLIVGITFIFTFLLPALNALILLKLGRIRSLEMETSAERVVPYFSTLMYYLALVYLFFSTHISPVFIILIAGAALSILATFIINFKWKISAHTVGIGGVIGAALGISLRLMIDLQYIIIIAILLSGIIGFARLKLSAHTPAQVYTGFLTGFLIQLLLMIFIREEIFRF